MTMGSFRPQSYVKATSSDEVVELLSREGERVRVIGGGTTIYEMANRGLLSHVTTLVDITKLGLRTIREDSQKGVVFIGACSTFTDMLRNKTLGKHPCINAVLDALNAIKPVQVRNVATIGGSVCGGIPLFDLPVALLALGTNVLIRGSQGERMSPMEDFIGTFKVGLKDGEFVLGFEVQHSHAASSFEKFAFTGDDWAIVNCATRVFLDDRGLMRDCRVVFGGGVQKVTRDEEAERALEGLHASDDTIQKAVEDSTRKIEFINDSRSSDAYRRKVARYLLRVSLLRTLKQFGSYVG